MARERRFNRGGERERSEYEQKLLDVRRVARVMAGGRRFSFRATIVIGNRRGKVGVAVAKGPDVTIATEKAVARAKKHLLVVPITPSGSIAHEIRAKYAAARVFLWPRPAGSGIVAGGSVRAVVELAGIANISAKILSRSSNKLTNAMATLEALKQLKPRNQEARSKNQETTAAS
ncbi:MAG: hypothetical protein A3B37_02990 [Candidatus Sungbacteria bacterium RIFCSPLOWO2_01_FULL_59_16]|uniref:Small ribosomal subunit protein uS5 n=1 Tax=Candidatus Sungbacteria bacterium RIFCSPLOWO2_01_FULL_59_16 TaxID=1802280 RepID=A0A1G2LBI0_9BACT|nr:MAG: hypothetical protein A3B37_02990 [Candidatus Sungbacteria bacterium RIFCSPLOWO2_01_FULL_59_16]